MRAFAHLPMLGGLLVAAASSQQTSDLSRRNEKLHRFYENEAKTGSCLIYVNKSVTNDGKTPCRIFCKNSGQPETTVGCHSEHVYNPNQKYPWDTDGNEYLPGKCLCADKIDPVTEAIATPVIESLANLDKVICGVFVQSVVESISIGFAFVPGGQGVTVARAATRAAVEGAKSFAENGMNPGDFFDGWVKKSCGLDKLQLDYADTFASLVNAPDSAGTSTGCKRKKKSDCKKLDAKPDPKTTKKDDGPKTTTTKKEDGPTTTTTKTEAGPTTTTTTTTSTSTSTSASASASASSSGTPVTCESCRSPGAKKAARDARWGSMFVPRAAGGDTCLLDNSKGGDSCEAGGGDLAARDGLLSERALTRADPMLNVNGRDFWIDCGQHKPCGQAKGDSNIDKYYYLEGDAKCGGDLKHGTFRDVGNSVFQNDHVYEKQTLALFLQWLGDGSTTPIGASTKPRPAWVAEVLLDEDSPRNFKLQPSNRPLGIPQGGAPLDDVLAYGIARSDPLSRRRGGTAGMPIERAAKNFALVEADVNEQKGTFFGEGTPKDIKDPHPGKANLNRNWIRNTAGVFHYLRYTHGPNVNKENVWNKWMRVSNWVDLVLSEFDQSYPWGNNGDEPKGAGGGPSSLRSWYAYWIDTYLGGIEANARLWAVAAQTQFRNKYGSDNEPAATRWMTKAFGANGFARQSEMTLPRPGTGGTYGAYGNPTMTFDAAGNAVVLAAPALL